jgi:peptidoglycan/LPS O-acetylase OafA/YrhL
MGQFRQMSKLGVFTYGLYCLHLLGITFVFKLIGKLHLNGQSPFLTIAATAASLVLAIIISWASYNFYEKKFLKIKARFAVVPSKGGGSL